MENETDTSWIDEMVNTDEDTGGEVVTPEPGTGPDAAASQAERTAQAAEFIRQNEDLVREAVEAERGRILAEARQEEQQQAQLKEWQEAVEEAQSTNDYDRLGRLYHQAATTQAAHQRYEKLTSEAGDARVGAVLEQMFTDEFGEDIYTRLNAEQLSELERQPDEAPAQHFARVTATVREWESGEGVSAGEAFSPGAGAGADSAERGSASSAFNDFRSEVYRDISRRD